MAPRGRNVMSAKVDTGSYEVNARVKIRDC